jgi:hypothetical protein
VGGGSWTSMVPFVRGRNRLACQLRLRLECGEELGLSFIVPWKVVRKAKNVDDILSEVQMSIALRDLLGIGTIGHGIPNEYEHD